MSFKKKVVLALLPLIGYLLIRLLYLTCKKKFDITKDVPNEPFIVALWHGELLMQPFLYKKLRKKGKLAIIISEHRDGEIIAKIMSYFGFDSIRGSSTRGGIKALKESFKKASLGFDIAITPDGPKGPRHSVADGIVAVAAKKKMKIVALNYKASSFWQFKSWDRFIVPKPFSTLFFFASDPIEVTMLDKQSAKELIRKKLLKNAA